MDAVYCITCNKKTAYIVKYKQAEMKIRGTAFKYLERTAYCPVCGEDLYVPEINDLNAMSRKESYRKAVEKQWQHEVF